MLKVFNTLTGQLEPFEPIEPGKVRMYVCGPTVYDFSHIGHGRAYVAYDVIARYLRRKGFQVRYVRNITDIDDKIIKRSNDEKIEYWQLASRFADEFNEDMRRLGLTPPSDAPKASETIPEIIEITKDLIHHGKAYAAGGDVYFSVRNDPKYGKLSGKNLDDLEAGARVDPTEQKRDPLDFALWKAAKPGEPHWSSPWGEGRPGWHIECSAMVKKLMGDEIDLHAGGRDLIFPHHENEIAQSEGATGKPLAKYWLHNGFVNINKEKMSKSLGNFVTLRKLLELFHPEALKLFLLSSHYRSPIDFSDAVVEEAARGLDRMYRVLLSIPNQGTEKSEGKYIKAFEEAMDDDFNTAKGLAAIFDAIKEANKLQAKPETLAQACALRREILDMAETLGLLRDDPMKYFQNLPGAGAVDRMKVEQLIAARAEARRQKNFAQADRIREELKAMKVTVEDAPEGTTWRVQ